MISVASLRQKYPLSLVPMGRSRGHLFPLPALPTLINHLHPLAWGAQVSSGSSPPSSFPFAQLANDLQRISFGLSGSACVAVFHVHRDAEGWDPVRGCLAQV